MRTVMYTICDDEIFAADILSVTDREVWVAGHGMWPPAIRDRYLFYDTVEDAHERIIDLAKQRVRRDRVGVSIAQKKVLSAKEHLADLIKRGPVVEK